MKLLIIILLILTTSCMGVPPQLIEKHQYGDEQKSCDTLESEIAEIEIKIKEKHSEHQNKIASNIVVGVAGALLLWPALFLLDTGSDELAEIDSLSKRKETLHKLCIDNDCYLEQP